MLKCCNVESNPGFGYTIEKVQLGTLHQGGQVSVVDAGVQCASNYLFLLC